MLMFDAVMNPAYNISNLKYLKKELRRYIVKQGEKNQTKFYFWKADWVLGYVFTQFGNCPEI